MGLADEISLAPGSRVGYAGQAWIVENQEDPNRVLVRNAETGRREFLTIDQIGDVALPPEQEAGTKSDADTSANEDGPGRWARKLAQRRLRGVEISKDDAKGNPRIKEAAKTTAQADRFAALTEILKLPRGERKKDAITAYASRFECSISTVYSDMKKAEIFGKPEAIAHAERSDKGRFRLSEKALAVAKKHLDAKHFVATPLPLRAVCDDINVELMGTGESLSENTLRKFAASLKSPQELLLARGRKDQARDEHRPKVGHLPGNDAPLRIVQIDHTPTQVVLVDEKHRLPISDAVLSIVIDSFSRMVLAFVLSFEAPSVKTIGALLGRAFLPKGEFLKKVGVEGEWPCYGFPGIIHVDGGAEMNGHFMHSVKRARKFNLRNRPKGQPNFGGHVETAFGTYMKQLGKSLPGTKFSNPKMRGEYDAEGNAVLTIKEFEYCFTEWLVNQYHRDKHSGDGMNDRTPLQAWYDGIFVGDENNLPIGLLPVPRHQEELRISLLPIKHKTLNQGAVRINTLSYYSKELEDLSAVLPSFADKHGKEDRTFEIHYDPNNLTFIWLYEPSSKKYIEGKVQDLEWEDKSLWELIEYRKRLRQPDADVVVRSQSRDRVFATISNAAVKKTKAARKRKEEAARQDGNSVIAKKPRAPRKNEKITTTAADLEDFLSGLKPRKVHGA